MNILIVEPDSILARTYAQYLVGMGHQVVVAQDAANALSALDKSTPDIIVLEPQLATHDGIELLYEIRSYDDWQHVPVVLHTHIPKSRLVGLEHPGLGIAGYAYKHTTTLRQFEHILRRTQLVPSV